MFVFKSNSHQTYSLYTCSVWIVSVSSLIKKRKEYEIHAVDGHPVTESAHNNAFQIHDRFSVALFTRCARFYYPTIALIYKRKHGGYDYS